MDVDKHINTKAVAGLDNLSGGAVELHRRLAVLRLYADTANTGGVLEAWHPLQYVLAQWVNLGVYGLAQIRVFIGRHKQYVFIYINGANITNISHQSKNKNIKQQ